MAEEEVYSASLEHAPTWVVAGVCAVIVFISLFAERALHAFGKLLKRNKQHALCQALQKLQSELMLLGFISLLLSVFQGLLSEVCIPERLTNSMLPCKKPENDKVSDNLAENYLQRTWNRRRLLSEGESTNHCSKGKVPLLSLEAIHQLHIFIFALAVVYVVFCATTMVLGGMKVRKWRHWEECLKRELSNAEKGLTRVSWIHTQHQLILKQRAARYCNWMRSFFKQFYYSVSKSDYIALRHGFIMAHCPLNPRFDFHTYMMRTLERDFKKVVGISSYLWAFVVIFLLVNLKGWHSYFWLSFLPLILLLLVGAKLEGVITSLAEEIAEGSSETNRTENKPEDESVKPSDKHFWFGRPSIVLYLIHFILFQNSFEIAFLFWVMCTYGLHSCILDKVAFIAPRLIIGILVQVLCSYSTLPLYTIVTRMGSRFKQSAFDEQLDELELLDHTSADDHPRDQAKRSLRMLLSEVPVTPTVDPHQEPSVTIEISTASPARPSSHGA